ncbi:hypothetical protein AGMMS49925_02780 [Deltaproteobacteria bacterium]|nr:hypothetical protein AGMMS49925_02780 [Deltaproteobacteria bacterium]
MSDIVKDTSVAAGGVHAPEELALDGVRYVDLPHAGRRWRLGSVTPRWREALTVLGVNPGQESVSALETHGLWLAQAATPAAAVMCCGLGSAWPHMGRELYDNFPAAREAMDHIAAVADWDVLSLMDERDAEKISLTRWQQPYLFLLEYAQWSQLASLGLRPALMCGHSLGELIALCFAGVYEPEVAWYILDTRARHMAELEAASTRKNGMMAVHAEADVIDEMRGFWPALVVSNYNTPRQFIISGPREALSEARRSLRKRRIPSIMLNVGLAYHHPAMRVLRDLSLRRLNALEMRAPRLKMLSNVTAGPYPEDQPDVCRFITDLDENAVRWTECVRRMRDQGGIRHFVELGPQDTLCSLTTDIEPGAFCLPVTRKGKETEQMRQACARLYALGFLPHAAVRACADVRAGNAGPAVAQTDALSFDATPQKAAICAADTAPALPAERLRRLTDILAQASGRPAETIKPETDLRYDLALRSSRFPLLIQEIEDNLCLRVHFERLLGVATVGDLARALWETDASRSAPNKTDTADEERGAVRKRTVPALCRYALRTGEQNADEMPSASPVFLPPDPCGEGAPLRRGDVLACCVFDRTMLPRLLSGLAPLGCVLAVPGDMLDACAPLAKAGSRLAALPFDGAAPPDVGAVRIAVEALAAGEGRVDGLLFVPALDAALEESHDMALFEACRCPAAHAGLRYILHFRRTPLSALSVPTAARFGQITAASARAGGAVPRIVRLADDGGPVGLHELGDMLAWEVLRGTEENVLWARQGVFDDDAPPRRGFVERPEVSSLIFPNPRPLWPPSVNTLDGSCHFSRFADPRLSTCLTPQHAMNTGMSCVPASRAMQAIVEGAGLLFPWLTVSGLSDMRFFDAPLLPPGVTRECRLAVKAQPWMLHDRVMTRMCRAVLSVRCLTANGRRVDKNAEVISGMALMSPVPAATTPIWDAPGAADMVEHAVPATCYDAMGLGAHWRLITAFAALPDDMYQAVMPAAEEGIAQKGNSRYSEILCIVEGIVQTAWLAVASRGGALHASSAEIATVLRLWRLNAAGLILFSALGQLHGRRLVQLRKSWEEASLLRFDAQVTDARGHVLATMLHLEFSSNFNNNDR